MVQKLVFMRIAPYASIYDDFDYAALLPLAGHMHQDEATQLAAFIAARCPGEVRSNADAFAPCLAIRSGYVRFPSTI